jgi:hypothetical protein
VSWWTWAVQSDGLPYSESELEAWYREQAPWSWLGGPRRRDREDARRIRAVKEAGERCRT